MIIDSLHEDRYFILNNGGVSNGWNSGWNIFNRLGSPKIDMDIKKGPTRVMTDSSQPLDWRLWPDTKDYDQNSPGILATFEDLDRRVYKSDIDKTFWLNVTRVPLCASYLAACAKVKPDTILELGTGGDSAHSTGMFLYWHTHMTNNRWTVPLLVSVDRHPLSHAWIRYRKYKFWNFIQGDSISAMKMLMEKKIGKFPDWYDMIFIDSSHTYPHTLKEIEQASNMTDAILLDDTTITDIRRSINEFMMNELSWVKVELAHGVTLMERRPYV